MCVRHWLAACRFPRPKGYCRRLPVCGNWVYAAAVHGRSTDNKNVQGPRWRLYLFVVVLTGVTLLLRLGMTPWDGGHPLLIVFLFPIVISAYIGGLKSGLLATVLAGLASYYFLLPPVHSFGFATPEIFAQWLFLLLIGVLISALFGDLDRMRRGRADEAPRAATSPRSARSASALRSRWHHWARSASSPIFRWYGSTRTRNSSPNPSW